jgi:hypoxanthine-guanine phosphoribosyltransferase
VDLGIVKQYLHRTAWEEFPDVVVCAPTNVVLRHPQYDEAKIGSARAAEELVTDVLSVESLRKIETLIGPDKPHLLAVHALESEGMNAIPRVLALKLAQRLGLNLDSGIVQINRVTHTRADGYHRLAYPPVFEGKLPETDYLLVDDFIGQGGTLANLRGHVELQKGHVVGAISLTGKQYSAHMHLNRDTLLKLRSKHGDELERWWIATFGYGLDRLTESEAQFLCRSESFEHIAAQLAGARGTGN